MAYKKGDYERYHASPEKIAERSSRNKAVRKLGREGKASKDGKEVDHRDGSPLHNSRKNLRVVKRHTNRVKQ